MNWSLYWGVLAVAVAGVMVYFLVAYHGIGRGLKPATKPAPSSPEDCGDDGIKR